MEYKKISEAIEQAKKDIDMSFDKFIENLRLECLDSLTDEQEKKLQEYFNNLREWGGLPITKDNCEDLFEQFLEGISLEELNNILYEIL